MEVQVGKLLQERELSLAVAESCTGGYLSHLVTNVPGASGYFRGGVIAYDNRIKSSLLGVQEQTLAQYGAVSKETVLELAEAVRRLFTASIGIGITGIAGPGGGTASKPVGTVWIGFSAPDKIFAEHHFWPGKRILIKENAAQQALSYLIEYLLEE